MSQSRQLRSFALSDVFSKRGHCHLIDLRNHGESDQHDSMTYEDMANDLVRYLDKAQVSHVNVIGHAMGAKIGMALATLFEDRVQSVIALDAAPVDNALYDKDLLQKNQKSLDDLLSLDIEGKTRKTVIDMLNEKFEDKGVAALVSMNIIYDGNQSNTVKW